MKSNNRIYSFFIFIALLFWNPLSYFLIYSHNPLFSDKTNKLFYLLYSAVFVTGIILICLIQKNKIAENIRNLIFSITFTGILFSGLVVLDCLIGLTIKQPPQSPEGIIFKPLSRAVYQTTEFDYTVDINSLGLRDREFPVDKGDKYRILCFGDSWTYGWGVNIENTWPKKLEQYLLSEGFENIEIINCGQGGQYSTAYKKFIRKAVPLLKPDLVLVGVLQADDLAQLYERNFEIEPPSKPSASYRIFRKVQYVAGTYLQYSFKNTKIFLGSRISKTADIKSNWKASSKSIVENFTRLEKLRFNALDNSVQDLFKSGNLNPSLIKHYIKFPERFLIFNNPDHPATQFAVKEMKKDFREMKDTCVKHNSQLVFINLPINYFIGHQVIRTPSDILNPYFEKNNNIDTIYRSVADDNSLPYIELTQHFIDLPDKTGYFFKYDGHPNEKGYLQIANYIGKTLIDKNILKK